MMDAVTMTDTHHGAVSISCFSMNAIAINEVGMDSAMRTMASARNFVSFGRA